jgi:preprotein translocase subunit SecB
MNIDLHYPIELVQTFFVRSVIIAIPSWQSSESAQVGPHLKLNVPADPDTAGIYTCSMRVTFNPNQDQTAPYFIEMECIGQFKSTGVADTEKTRRALAITAHNILHGAIREAVTCGTSRQANGPIVFGLAVLDLNSSTTTAPTPPEN